MNYYFDILVPPDSLGVSIGVPIGVLVAICTGFCIGVIYTKRRLQKHDLKANEDVEQAQKMNTIE